MYKATSKHSLFKADNSIKLVLKSCSKAPKIDYSNQYAWT